MEKQTKWIQCQKCGAKTKKTFCNKHCYMSKLVQCSHVDNDIQCTNMTVTGRCIHHKVFKYVPCSYPGCTKKCNPTAGQCYVHLHKVKRVDT